MSSNNPAGVGSISDYQHGKKQEKRAERLLQRSQVEAQIDEMVFSDCSSDGPAINKLQNISECNESQDNDSSVSIKNGL